MTIREFLIYAKTWLSTWWHLLSESDFLAMTIGQFALTILLVGILFLLARNFLFKTLSEMASSDFKKSDYLIIFYFFVFLAFLGFAIYVALTGTSKEFIIIIIWPTGLLASIFLARRKKIKRLNFAIRFFVSILSIITAFFAMAYASELFGLCLFILALMFFYYSMAQRMNDIGYARWWVVLTPSIFGIVIIPMLLFVRSEEAEMNAGKLMDVNSYPLPSHRPTVS